MRKTGTGGVLAVLALVGGLLAGCSGKTDGGRAGASASGSPPTSASSSPSGTGQAEGTAGHEGDDADATAAPPFPANTDPDTQQASSDAFGNVTDVRIGHHEGFDRVVLQFGGRGTPGWDVRYVDQPASQGSGAPIDIPGNATLQATVTGVGLPPDTGVAEYSGPRSISGSGTEAITEAMFDGTFEGTTVVFIGTAAKTPFRAYLIRNPVRIVIDVAGHSS